MKKALKLALALTLVFALVFAAAGCGEKTPSENQSPPPDVTAGDQTPDAASGGKLDDIKNSGTLVVYTDPNFAPFEYIGDDEAIVGVDIALAEEIAAELGATVDVRSASFDSILMALKGGRGDVAISGFTITEERRESVDFSIPYIDSVQYLILPEAAEVPALEGLAGQTVGVAKGYTGQLLIEGELETGGALDGQNVTVKAYNSAMEAVLDLNTGRLSAVIMDEYVAKTIADNTAGVKAVELCYADGTLASEQYGVAVPKGNEALLEAVNAVIERLTAEGRIAEWVVDYSAVS
ncbi:MAG: transporter substrate-binding domain-containing protein [Oscillospiraceae bacterium]|jgi:polar amino acid transport system substrate-binding protein|nr:transporter substrate-binding domain-containing protein [Oscillospiraceae bacterium]